MDTRSKRSRPISHFTPPPFVNSPAGSFHPCIDLRLLADTLKGPLPADPRRRIVGPHDLHVLHSLRRLHRVAGAGEVPADFFIWATGEPPHRAMTKLGGVPYLPAAMAWPERDGTFGDFYGQLCFLDSKDLVPPLPGDVLLVFRFHDLEHNSWDRELYDFRWVDVKAQELISPAAVRTSRVCQGEPDPAFGGYRMRTYDIPGQVERIRADASLPSCHLHNAEVTKIGGAATDVQSVWEPKVPRDHRFLGQFTALWPAVGVPWPVVDRPAPVAEFPSPEFKALVSGPGDGVTCLYLDGRGDVQVNFSCA